ncbi:hypothetical protein [Enterococcus sp. AZ103]|uniref:hypothetical protein n=1 Tax=Enterococcus sp. AZ103 TaxID=2774628 RepID=UPI003F25942F
MKKSNEARNDDKTVSIDITLEELGELQSAMRFCVQNEYADIEKLKSLAAKMATGFLLFILSND